MMSSRQKSRLLPAGDEVMSAEMMSSRQKPRFLPAGDEVMSAEIAAGNFSQ
jgi:hypothetical protein